MAITDTSQEHFCRMGLRGAIQRKDRPRLGLKVALLQCLRNQTRKFVFAGFEILGNQQYQHVCFFIGKRNKVQRLKFKVHNSRFR